MRVLRIYRTQCADHVKTPLFSDDDIGNIDDDMGNIDDEMGNIDDDMGNIDDDMGNIDAIK